MTPMIRQPTTGTRMLHRPRWCVAGETADTESRWKKNRLVKKAISASSPLAASADSGMVRTPAVKSPRRSPLLAPWVLGVGWATGVLSVGTVVAGYDDPFGRRFEEHRGVSIGQGHRLDQLAEPSRQLAARPGPEYPQRANQPILRGSRRAREHPAPGLGELDLDPASVAVGAG